MADLDKLVDELSSLTILEASQLKTKLEETWGVEAAVGGAMMMAAPGGAVAGGDAEPEEAKTEFDLLLKDIGPKKINVIKAIRGFTDLGLKEAKALVEEAPVVVLEQLSKDAVEDGKAKLEEAGAVAEIK